jgi:Kef-type K+ transport system membrane component KefB
MSARGGKSTLGRVVDALSLTVVFGILYVGVSLGADVSSSIAVLGALGFLLLAGTLTGEILEVIKLPHLTGYLIAGILAGPHVGHLIEEGTVKRLAPVNTLALALIALAGGAELRIDQLRSGLKSLAVSTVVQNLFVVCGVSGVFIAARSFIPFTADYTFSGVVAIALGARWHDAQPFEHARHPLADARSPRFSRSPSSLSTSWSSSSSRRR